MTLPERLIAIHRALDEAGIPHAFGGAIALAYWTLDPRGTSDIDVNIFVPSGDCATALDALPGGVTRPEGTVEKVVAEGQVRVWWDQTPVDLFFDYVPIHTEAARNRENVPFEGTTIPILGPVELLVFKAMFDRTRDWADIEAMVSASSVDLDAARTALASLLSPDDQRFTRLDEAIRLGSAGPDA